MQQISDDTKHLLRLVTAPGEGAVARAASALNVSRQTIAARLRKLIAQGVLSATGVGRGRRYKLVVQFKNWWEYPLTGADENVLFRESIASHIADLPENVRNIWHYGFTEMVNNAIDHSDGSGLSIIFERDVLGAALHILDNGEGIFHRIQRLVGLYDPREAILELAKGKLTTDSAHHSGEGIFFTSRVFDSFHIRSRELLFTHTEGMDDVIFDMETEIAAERPGTTVAMYIEHTSPRTTQGVFNQFALPDEFTFAKTIVPVRLARHEGESLVSRSQAKRLVTRFERFKTVWLDFNGVAEIGQAFADEVFRVFANAHPEVTLAEKNTTAAVQAMIERARAKRAESA